MTLLDRYLHEVGRHLPRSRRDDILAELRSSLLDRLEDLAGDAPVEEDMVQLLHEMGPPREVAASYYPDGQYLIGPTLYPLFKMTVTIWLLVSLGAQLIAWLVAILIGGETLADFGTPWAILNSVPVTLGIVVIIFAILQRMEVRPEMKRETWDPRSLPQPSSGAPVKRGERIVGIVVGVIFLGIFTAYPERIGIYNLSDGSFWGNPVLGKYLTWISLSIIAGIGVDLYLIWHGVWDWAARLAKIGSNIVSMVILSLLFQAHNTWLAARGVGPLLSTLDRLGAEADLLTQIWGMQLFRLGIGIALLVITIESVALGVRLVVGLLGSKTDLVYVALGKR